MVFDDGTNPCATTTGGSCHDPSAEFHRRPRNKNHLRYLRITFLQINSPRNQLPPSCLSKTTRFPPKTCVFSYLHIRSISAKLALRTITPMTRTCPALPFVPFCFFLQSGIPSPTHPCIFYYEPFPNHAHLPSPLCDKIATHCDAPGCRALAFRLVFEPLNFLFQSDTHCKAALGVFIRR